MFTSLPTLVFFILAILVGVLVSHCGFDLYFHYD